MALNFREDQLRAVCAKLRAYLASGDNDHKACERLGLSWADYEEIKNSMLELETSRVRDRPPEQVYVEYLMNQESNVQALTDMIETFKESKQHNAMVGAVKARAEIYDKMIAKGQEFGFITKMPDRQEIVAGVMVTHLSNHDLRSVIAGELSGLDEMMRKYGSKSIVDIEPGKLHFPDSSPIAALPAGKVKRHARNRVHKGRRIVKEKVDIEQR